MMIIDHNHIRRWAKATFFIYLRSACYGDLISMQMETCGMGMQGMSFVALCSIPIWCFSMKMMWESESNILRNYDGMFFASGSNFPKSKHLQHEPWGSLCLEMDFDVQEVVLGLFPLYDQVKCRTKISKANESDDRIERENSNRKWTMQLTAKYSDNSYQIRWGEIEKMCNAQTCFPWKWRRIQGQKLTDTPKKVNNFIMHSKWMTLFFPLKTTKQN